VNINRASAKTLPETESRNLGAMILRGERKLTLNHVRVLSRRFRVSADLFLS
jgi:antitoxin component HigA of HigAB toxin-antitoxin module